MSATPSRGGGGGGGNDTGGGGASRTACSGGSIGVGTVGGVVQSGDIGSIAKGDIGVGGGNVGGLGTRWSLCFPPSPQEHGQGTAPSSSCPAETLTAISPLPSGRKALMPMAAKTKETAQSEIPTQIAAIAVGGVATPRLLVCLRDLHKGDNSVVDKSSPESESTSLGLPPPCSLSEILAISCGGRDVRSIDATAPSAEPGNEDGRSSATPSRS